MGIRLECFRCIAYRVPTFSSEWALVQSWTATSEGNLTCTVCYG